MENSAVNGPNQRIRLDLAYDGTAFAGWAKQPGLVTVQGVLEEALAMVFREPVHVTVAGRTDAGVHALHQVIHFDIPEQKWEAVRGRGNLEPEEALPRKLRGALSRQLNDAEAKLGVPARLHGLLQKAITVSAASEMPPTFDARFSALERRYRYLIEDGFLTRGSNPLLRQMAWQIDDELDLDLMNVAASELLGLHDFLSFCKPREGSTTIRDLREIIFSRREDQLIEVMIRADAFCHNMVRTLIASLVLVGQGKKDVLWLRDRIENPRRDSEVRLATPRGLALAHIEYPAKELFAVQSEQARALRRL